MEFLAPGFLLLLVLPLAALVLGARGGAVIALVTGTLESWRAAQRARPAQEKRKLNVPPALWCLAAALVCAALALARPQRVVPQVARRFTLVVDRSPSMYLVEQGKTRLERALDPLRAWIARERRAGDEFLWLDAAHPDGRLGDAPPDDLFDAPGTALSELDWPRFDRSDALWIGDRFDSVPRLAGFSASGGAAVPGAIGREGRTRLDWDGERVRRVENAWSASDLACFVDPNLPEPLRALAALWAAQQGLEVHDAARGGELLAIVLVRSGEARAVDLARDGWSARSRIAAPLAPALGESSWLSNAGPCVLSSKGRVRVSIAELDEPAGDPAAFAVSWGALFDSALADPPGVVALAERTARGAPAWRAPAGVELGGPQASPRALGGWFALGAALLALLAWVLRGLRA